MLKMKRVLSAVLVMSMVAGSFINFLSSPIEFKDENTKIASEWVDGELGYWEYGVTDGISKSVFSNLVHTTKIHRTSCEIGGRWGYSGPVAPGEVAQSSTEKITPAIARAYYSFEDEEK